MDHPFSPAELDDLIDSTDPDGDAPRTKLSHGRAGGEIPAENPPGGQLKSRNRNPQDPPPRDRLKGIALAAFIQWYAAKRDPQKLRDVIARMAPEHQALLAPERPGAGVIASTWYPSAMVHALLDGLTEDLSEDELQLLAEQGEGAVMDATLHGVHRLFFRMLITPERFARYAQPLWSRFFDSGNLESRVEGDVVYARVNGWRGYHCFICRMNREGARVIHEAMGRQVIRVEVDGCRAKGDAACTNRILLRAKH